MPGRMLKNPAHRHATPSAILPQSGAQTASIALVGRWQNKRLVTIRSTQQVEEHGQTFILTDYW